MHVPDRQPFVPSLDEGTSPVEFQRIRAGLRSSQCHGAAGDQTYRGLRACMGAATAEAAVASRMPYR